MSQTQDYWARLTDTFPNEGIFLLVKPLAIHIADEKWKVGPWVSQLLFLLWSKPLDILCRLVYPFGFL